MCVSSHTPTSETYEWGGVLGRWLIFGAGLAVLVAALILPAQIDLRNTRIQRDLALHNEQAQHTRIDRYESFLNELDRPTQSTIELLAMSQLGVIPNDREALIIPGQPADPQLFEFLEPALSAFEPPRSTPSRLELLTTDIDSRFWFVLIGAIAVMYGLLPAATSRSSLTKLSV